MNKLKRIIFNLLFKNDIILSLPEEQKNNVTIVINKPIKLKKNRFTYFGNVMMSFENEKYKLKIIKHYE